MNHLKSYKQHIEEATALNPHETFTAMMKDILDNKVETLERFVKRLHRPATEDETLFLYEYINKMFEPYGIKFLATTRPGIVNPAGLGEAFYNFQNNTITVEYHPALFVKALLTGREIDSIEDLVGHEMVHKMQWEAIRKAKRVLKARKELKDKRKIFYDKCKIEDPTGKGDPAACDIEVHNKMMTHKQNFYLNDPMEVMAWAWSICIGLRKYIKADKVMKVLEDPEGFARDFFKVDTEEEREEIGMKVPDEIHARNLSNIVGELAGIKKEMTSRKWKNFKLYVMDYMQVDATQSQHGEPFDPMAMLRSLLAH